MIKANRTKSGLILSGSVDSAITISEVGKENQVPVYRFKKEIIRTGKYFKSADDLAFTVTTDVLDHWVKTFREWKQSGNKVAVPETHDGAQDPTKNRGWVIDMFREGESLYATMDLYGSDAPKIAATNDVSIYCPIEVVDGKGKVFSRPITHVALCTDPVIPGLSKFEAIAASRQYTNKEHKMDLKELAKILDLSLEDVKSEEDKEKKILASVKALKAAFDEEEKKKIEAALDEDEEEKKKLEASFDEDEEEKLEASLDEDEKKKGITASHGVSPLLLSLAAENREIKIQRMVDGGKITPNVANKLRSKYVDRKALRFSLQRGGDNFDEILGLFAINDPVELAEMTGPQIMKLGDLLKSGDKNPLLEDAAARNATN